jgi:thiol-disulfide isomerase/thioredoxin
MNLYDIKTKLFKTAGDKKYMLMILLSIIFLIAALYVYKNYVTGKIRKNYVTNDEFSNKDNQEITSADIYFFYTEWCPHCKTAKPVWADFKNQMQNKSINGITLNFYEVDCDKDTATSEKFDVKGFPTIKLLKGNQIIEYDAKPSTVNLIEFVNSSLGGK